MQIVLEYLNNQMIELENSRSAKETLINSKIIETNEIHKAVSKLTLNDNDTYNFFSASGSKMEFQSREISTLKFQEDNLRLEADKLADEVKEINVQIESLAIAIAHANESNSKIKSLSNEVIHLNGEVAMYSTGGKKAKKEKKSEPEKKEQETITLSSNVESFDIDKNSEEFLEEVSDRIFFISRILKFDQMRVKLELDEVYKAIKKYINK